MRSASFQRLAALAEILTVLVLGNVVGLLSCHTKANMNAGIERRVAIWRVLDFFSQHSQIAEQRRFLRRRLGFVICTGFNRSVG